MTGPSETTSMSVNTDPKLDFERPCPIAECIRLGTILRQLCTYHSILSDARRLSADDLVSLRSELADVTVLSDEERMQEVRDARLRDIKLQVEHLARADARAREAGISDSDIAMVKDPEAGQRRVVEQQKTAEHIVTAFKTALAELGLTDARRDQAIRTFLAGFPH